MLLHNGSQRCSESSRLGCEQEHQQRLLGFPDGWRTCLFLPRHFLRAPCINLVESGSRQEASSVGPGRSTACSFPLQPRCSAALLFICKSSAAAAKRETPNSRPRGRAAAAQKGFCVRLQRAAAPGSELCPSAPEARTCICAEGEQSCAGRGVEVLTPQPWQVQRVQC